MKKTIYTLLIAASLVACSKQTETPWTAPDPSNPFPPTTGSDVNVSVELYKSASYVVQGGTAWWAKVHLSAKYGLNATGKIYFKFQNSYFTTPNTRLVNIALPVVNRDTAIETNQVASASSTASNFVIDSIRCSNTAYRFMY